MNTPLTQNSEIKTVLNTTGFHLVKNLGDHAPEQLEKVIHGIVEEDLNYGGTSPRLRKSGKVFTSSEIKNFFPLPVHCEMSFLPNPPKTMYFYCKEQSEQGGETPLVDFRAVYNSLDPSFKEKLERFGVKYIRNYDSASTKKSFDLLKLKSWEDLFQTNCKKQVEQNCSENDQEVKWKANDKLAISNSTKAFKQVNNERSWFNHIQVFHPLAVLRESKNIFKFKKDLRSFLTYMATFLFTTLKLVFSKSEDLGMFCTYGNGEKFSKKEIDALQDCIWKNMQFVKLNPGDLLVVNNDFMAHGRMPFKGNRQIWVSWI